LQQRQRADDAVTQPLGEARRLLDEARQATSLEDLAKFAQARAAARRAGELARSGNASTALRVQAVDMARLAEEETEAAERDQTLLETLLEVRGPREGPQVRTDDMGIVVLAEPSAEEQFRAAFQSWDPTFNVDTVDLADLVMRLKRRPPAVLAHVVAALDEWAMERWRAAPQADWRRVVDLAAALQQLGESHQELRALITQGTLAQEKALGMLAMALRPVPMPFDVGLMGQRTRLRRIAAETDARSAPVLRVLTLTRALNEAGESSLAVAILRDALRARPKEVVAHATLGRLLAAQRRWQEAIESFAVARALPPHLGESLADALVRNNRVSEGLSLYQQLVMEQPANPWLRLRHGLALIDQGRYKEAEAEYRKALRLKPDYPEAHTNLGAALNYQGRHKEGEAAHREALRLRPDLVTAHANLGAALNYQGRHKEGEAACRAAIRLNPDYAEAHNNLGNALNSQGQHREGEAAYRNALRLQPDLPSVHNNLGVALNEQGRHKEAEVACRAAIRLQPDFPLAHNNLGNALYCLGRYAEAEAAFREALRLRPDFAEAHSNLGAALNELGRYTDAEAACREALRLRPDLPNAHCNLGLVLNSLTRYTDAEAACREALRLKPDYPEAHTNLGNALARLGRHKEGEAAYREALRLRPDFAMTHNNLGALLIGQGQYKDAEAACREALRVRPDFPLALANLGLALQAQGRFVEALQSLRRAQELGGKLPGSPVLVERIRRCERFVELDRKLPAVLKGEVEPASPVECLQLAKLCQIPAKSLYVTASRLYAEAFAANPKLADDLIQQFRYDAACSACLAAAEKGEDARLLPDKVIVMLRWQVLGWLRADLALYDKLAERDDTKQVVRQRLAHWQMDHDLSSVRDKQELAKLPDGDRPEWQRLWEDVAIVLRKSENKK
jgi:tetratricopeptide (TPR) repeat protein